jgi:xylose isomerase
VHFNDQKPLRYDQDLTFASENPKDAFFMVKLLEDHGYDGTKAFDAHPYRNEADPWDFVERNMRNYKILAEKVERYSEDREIQDLLKELHGPNPDWHDALKQYSSQQAAKLKETNFDVAGLTSRRLPLERLDQLVTEVLLGVR